MWRRSSIQYLRKHIRTPIRNQSNILIDLHLDLDCFAHIWNWIHLSFEENQLENKTVKEHGNCKTWLKMIDYRCFFLADFLFKVKKSTFQIESTFLRERNSSAVKKIDGIFGTHLFLISDVYCKMCTSVWITVHQNFPNCIGKYVKRIVCLFFIQRELTTATNDQFIYLLLFNTQDRKETKVNLGQLVHKAHKGPKVM